MTVMSAAVVGTSVTFPVMIVVVALYVRIKTKSAAEQCFNCGIRGAANTSVKFDSCLSKCLLCTAADTTANKSVNAECGKQSCKCSVTAAVQAGEIDAGRVERYRLLLAEVRETWKQRYN